MESKMRFMVLQASTSQDIESFCKNLLATSKATDMHVYGVFNGIKIYPLFFDTEERLVEQYYESKKYSGLYQGG